jgi:hypothetical protein
MSKSNTRSRAPARHQTTRKTATKATRKSSPQPGRAVALVPQKPVGDSALPSGTHQPGLRALTLFDTLPQGHVTFLVTEDGAEPHLRRNEYAVIDTTDREPQHGELYLVQSQSGVRRRYIVHATRSYANITGPGAADSEVWWLGDLRGFRQTREKIGNIPIMAGLSDGPFRAENLQSKLVGRIVGVALSSLGGLIAEQAGYQDEIGGNAAFDAAHYLDALITAGYRPYLINGYYFEAFPERRCEKLEMAVTAVRRKFVEAPTALERVKAECQRRGLVSSGRAA